MTTASTPSSFAHRLPQLLLAHLLLLGLLLLFTSSIKAQTSSTDGTTPVGSSPGAPAGSYPLSDFDQVNLFSGNLNFRLPLLSIGGRGSTQTKITLALNSIHWRTEQDRIDNGIPQPLVAGSGPYRSPVGDSNSAVYYSPIPNGWEGLDPGYGPGVLLGRRAGQGLLGDHVYSKTLTRLTFIASDGTEYELRDQLTGGQPYQNALYQQAFSRGTVFISADGNAATFISDSAITDYYNVADNPFVYPTGYLMLANGSRYRIEGGLVKWMRDRNGNRLSFTYGTNSSDPLTYKRVISITDSLNRVVTISYADLSTTMYDQISFKGAGGAQRTLKIWHTNLGQVLRPNSGYSVGTYTSLFPELYGASGSNYDPVDMVSAVELPDGRQYHFYYNPYGEVARVELPTGGAFEYDYTAGSGVVSYSEIHRRITQRRVLPDGANVVLKQIYNATYTAENSTGPFFTTVVVEQRDVNNSLLACSKHYFYGSPTASLYMLPTEYPSWKDAREYQSESLATDGSTVLQRGTSTWQQRASVSWWTDSVDKAPPNDPRLIETSATTLDTNQVAKRTFAYDLYNNTTDIWEYDYGSGAPLTYPTRHTQTDYLTANPVNSANYDTDTNIHLRNLPLRQKVYTVSPSTGAETWAAQTEYEYDRYDTTTNHDLLLNRSNISGLDSAFTINYYTRGNVTQVNKWLNSSGSSLVRAYAQFDIAGNVVKTIDPNNNAKTFDFSDRFGTPDGDARLNSSPADLSGQTSFAFVTSSTNALNHTAYTQFDYYLGRPVDSEDLNGVKSSSYCDDPLDRPTKLIHAVGTSVSSQTRFYYDDPNKTITTVSDKDTFGQSENVNGNGIKSAAKYDGLGRTIETYQYETASAYITVKTVYDALGRPYQVSNPYRSGDTVLWTTTAYDALSRAVSVTTPDNAVVSTAYSGNQVLVSDQAAKKHISQTNALGQLTDVWEITASDAATESVSFPGHSEVMAGYRTKYAYDALDDLTTTTQRIGTSGMTQTRSFVYDPLKRLTSVTNPEHGQITYEYDNNGNLLYRREAGTTVEFTYDALNRMTYRTVAGSGSSGYFIYYYYDDQNPPFTPTGFSRGPSKGRLVAAISETPIGHYQGNFYGYDTVGRVNQYYQRHDNGVDYATTGITYNLANEQTSETYPSGRTVTTAYDTAGRISGLSSSLSGTNLTLASNLTYAPSGGLASEVYGNNLTHSIQYNSRFQPIEIKLGTSGTDSILKLSYMYGVASSPTVSDSSLATTATQNNGNLARIRHTINGVLQDTQTFQYDQLNRLSYAVEHDQGILDSDHQTWLESYVYDRFGNRGLDNDNSLSYWGPSLDYFNPSNNRINATGYQYDQRGNLTQEPDPGATAVTRTYTYNSENQITVATVYGTATNYTYDAEGRRVKKSNNSTTLMRMVYNATGQLIAEYNASGSLTKEYLYKGGGLIATIEPGNVVKYATTDHLGTPRVWTNSGGGVVAGGRHDYQPFGGELFAWFGSRATGDYAEMESSQNDAQRKKFAGKERDNETGLDFLLTRYYSPGQGRFESVDPALSSIKLTHPQSFNRYTYALNNPLRYVDPDGRIPIETALDVISLAHSSYNLYNDPSWSNAGFFIWDAAATLIPYVPGSWSAKALRGGAMISREALEWSAKVGKLGHRGLKATGIVGGKLANALEVAVNNDLIRRGIALLSQGDGATRMLLKMPSILKAADFVGVTKSGTFVISEAKGTDTSSAIQQLTNTANALVNTLSDGSHGSGNVRIYAEIVMEKDKWVENGFGVGGAGGLGGEGVRGDQLVRILEGGRIEPVTIEVGSGTTRQSIPIHVRWIR